MWGSSIEGEGRKRKGIHKGHSLFIIRGYEGVYPLIAL